MKTIYTQLPLRAAVSNRQKVPIVTCGGIFSTPYQWLGMREFLLDHDYDLRLPELRLWDVPEFRRRRTRETLRDRVTFKIHEIHSVGERVPFISHSWGSSVMSNVVAERPHWIRGAIIIDHGPLPLMLPWNSAAMKKLLSRNFVGPMLRSFIPGVRPQVEVTPDQGEFLRDGTPDVDLAPDSAHLMRQYALTKVPKLSRFGCPVFFIFTANSDIMPLELKMEILDYHGLNDERNFTQVPGGHYPHCDPRYQDHLFDIIKRKLDEWS